MAFCQKLDVQNSRTFTVVANMGMKFMGVFFLLRSYGQQLVKIDGNIFVFIIISLFHL